MMKRILSAFVLLALAAGCATSGVPGNENGSAPLNGKEEQEYKKAIVRCYKTGGTRVVKVMGQLRCY